MRCGRRAADKVLAAVLEAEEERLVVEPCGENGDLLGRHPDELREILRRVLHRVAEADDVLRRRAAVDEPAQHRHRVRVVEQPRFRTELGHLVSEREHVIRCAQRPEDPPDPERVAIVWRSP